MTNTQHKWALEFLEAELDVGDFGCEVKLESVLSTCDSNEALVLVPTGFHLESGLAQSPAIAFNRAALHLFFQFPDKAVPAPTLKSRASALGAYLSRAWSRHLGWRFRSWT